MPLVLPTPPENVFYFALPRRHGAMRYVYYKLPISDVPAS